MQRNEQELALEARQGDLEAYGELVRCHQGGVFSVCYRLLGERGEAEDAAQEAFLRAHERLHLFDVSRPFGPWVRRVAANLCLNRLQARAGTPLSYDDEIGEAYVAPDCSPEAALERAERDTAIWQAILSLPAHYRAVIELRHFQEYSYDEIAQTLSISVHVVKVHLFRARKILAMRLQPDD